MCEDFENESENNYDNNESLDQSEILKRERIKQMGAPHIIMQE